jgi:hypothetical protein
MIEQPQFLIHGESGTAMERRQFITGLVTILIVAVLPGTVQAANRKFAFKIKTKDGSIIGNIVIEAKDPESAKYKLRQRYPECEILEMKEK